MSWQQRSFIALFIVLAALPLGSSQPWAGSAVAASSLGLGLGAAAGAIAAIAFPGWSLLILAPGLVAVGFWRNPIEGGAWLDQSLAVCCLILGFQVGYDVALRMRGDRGPNWTPYSESAAWRSFFGFTTVCLCVLVLALLLLPALPQAPVVMLPLAALTAAVCAAQFPRLSPSWAALGAAAAVPTSFCLGAHVVPEKMSRVTQDGFPTPNALSYPFDLLFLPPADPWMLCGLAVLGALPACWWLDQHRLDGVVYE